MGVSEYHNQMLEAWVKSGIRKSKASIVAEGLIAIQSRLNYEMDRMEVAKQRVDEEMKEREEELTEDV